MNHRRCLVLFLLLIAPAAPAEETGAEADAVTEAILFDSPPVVETATLYTQTIKDAPASVTVVTQQQIRTYGFRTLAEVLASVRGFYTTTDGGYQYVGVRGFGLPGDYNSRILVMLNGHYLTDNVYGAMYMFGQDFGLDMDLVQRIEIVRGPSSAIYGSNGVFATVNIYTRAPADTSGTSILTDVGSFGERKMLLSTSTYLGRGANLLLAASGFRSAGCTMRAAELDNAETARVGAEQGYHTFAQLTWRNWNITANFSDHRAVVPVGFYGADFGNSGTGSRDAHNFVDAALTKPAGAGAELRWRLYLDQFRYYGRYHHTMDGVAADTRDYALGEWVGTQLSYRRTLGRLAGLIFGTQTNIDLRNTQVSEQVSPSHEQVVNTRKRDGSYGVFGQYERALSKRWTVLGGIRFDDSRHNRLFFSPKAALVWKTSANTAYKFMSGRAFRNPSTFERFYEPNPLLEAERMVTVEFTREQRIGRRLELSTGAFQYWMTGLIEGMESSEVRPQYRNVGRSHAAGLHIEATGQPVRWLEASASFNAQRSRADHGGRFPNSPARTVQFRAAVPAHGKLMVSAAVRSLSSRETVYGERLGPATVADATATTTRLHPSFDLQVGVRNFLDKQYADPLSTQHLLSALPRAGRTFFFRVLWHYGD